MRNGRAIRLKGLQTTRWLRASPPSVHGHCIALCMCCLRFSKRMEQHFSSGMWWQSISGTSAVPSGKDRPKHHSDLRMCILEKIPPDDEVGDKCQCIGGCECCWSLMYDLGLKYSRVMKTCFNTLSPRCIQNGILHLLSYRP